ncbi:MAG: PAS domain S-box protein [Armatimonadetes bacterium]|nr:PAS domain S-box protein [Armatimonadota bacterium]
MTATLETLAAAVRDIAERTGEDPAAPLHVLEAGRAAFLGTYLRAKGDEDLRRGHLLESFAREADDVPSLVYSTDAEGRLTAINNGAAELLGYQPEDLIGQHYSVLMRADDAARMGWFIQERRTNDRATRRAKVVLRAADGQFREFEVSSSGTYGAQGEYLGTDGIARCVTDGGPQLEYQLDPEGRFVSISPSVAEALGYTCEEILGQHFSCLMETRERARVGPMFGERRSDERAANRIRVVLTGRNRVRREFQIRATGSYDEGGRFSGTTGVGHDVTGLTDTEQALTEGRRMLRRIYDAAGVGLALITPDLLVREVNRTLQSRRRQPLTETPCYAAFFGRTRECEWCGLREAWHGGRTVVRDEVLNPLDERTYQLIFTPVADDLGNVFGVVEASIDVTAAFQAHREDSRRQKQEAVDRMLDHLAGDAVAEHLARLRPRADDGPPGDLNAAVQAAVDAFGELPAGVELEFELQPALRLAACSTAQLTALVGELLANAAAAMPGGGELTIETHDGADGLALLVSDTGEGMTSIVARLAADPFFTTRPARAGLGLTRCRRLVEGCGGSLRFDTSPGAGTSVHVVLPPQEAP